jgi:mannose-6-phosphate isomerase-like protein (cupin superfamily)
MGNLANGLITSNSDSASPRTKLIQTGLVVLIGGFFFFLLADYGTTHFPKYKDLFEAVRALSLAAIPAFLVAIYDHYRTINEVSSDIARKIETSMLEVMERSIAGSKQWGLVKFHHRMNFERLIRELQPGDELLWLDTYCPSYPEFVDEIRSALERGVNLRVLVLDKDSANATFRANEILSRGYRAEKFKVELQSFSEEIVEAIREESDVPLKGTGAVVTYNDLPCIPMYLIVRKNQLYRGYSSFFLSKPSAFFVHLEWAPTNDGLLACMYEYFEHKWNTHRIRPIIDRLSTITQDQVSHLLDAGTLVDPQAGIKIVKLEDIPATNVPVVGNAAGLNYGFYAARVPPQSPGNSNYVNSHVHYHGEEPYHFLNGTDGEMSFGRIVDGKVNWKRTMVSPGDTVVIREGEVHSFRNNGSEPTDFTFACPDSHLIDKGEGEPEGDREWTKDLNCGDPPWYAQETNQ